MDVGPPPPAARTPAGSGILPLYRSITLFLPGGSGAPAEAGYLPGPSEIHEHTTDHMAAHSRACALEVSQGEVAGNASIAAVTSAVFAPRGVLTSPARCSNCR